MYKKKTIHIFKYHGTGNDFIIIENREGKIREEDKAGLAKNLCDRHFGIGGDGLIFVEFSHVADAKMRIFNPDGSEAEMCGNGIRCLGKYLFESGTMKQKLLIETGAGVKELALDIERGKVVYLAVDMGAPVDLALHKKLEADGRLWNYSFVNTGVPHAVIFVEDVENVDLEGISPAIRGNPVFKEGANVDFVQKIGERRFRIRTFERGVEAETLACGTGITAAGAVSVFLGLADEDVDIEFQARGGTVFIRLKRDGSRINITMKGPAEFVFEGEVPINL